MTKKKQVHIPVRTCVICRRKLPKRELRRFVIEQGHIRFDNGEYLNGRGYYCCAENCITKLETWIKKKRKK